MRTAWRIWFRVLVRLCVSAGISTDRIARLARCSPGHHTGVSQMRRLRLRHPAFPRDVVANPLEQLSPLISLVCKTVVKKLLVVPVPVGSVISRPLP